MGARAFRPALLSALAACLVVATGCSRKPLDDTSAQGTPLADIAQVAADDVTAFADLPGVDGFAELSPSLQAAVVSRANHAKCDCGCPGHSVNACLHQEEACDVALGFARGFVADAQALALNAPDADASVAAGESAPAPEGDSAPAVGVEPGSTSTPEGDPASAAPAPPVDDAGPPAEDAGPPAEGASAPAPETAPSGDSSPAPPAASGR